MNYREMSRLAGDPAAVRSTAGFVATALGALMSEGEREFLLKLSKFEGPDPLSMRQREWLHALRSRARRRAVVKGYRASTLVRKLWEQRFDLSEDAEEFLNKQHDLLKEHWINFTLSEPQWRYVFALCHEVGEIERYVDLE